MLFHYNEHTEKKNDISRKKETRRRLSSARCHSDSDTSGKLFIISQLIQSIFFSKMLV
jgi:hypothetical protein